MNRHLFLTLIVIASLGLALAQNPQGQRAPQAPQLGAGAPQPGGQQPRPGQQQLPPGTATLSGTVVAMGSSQPLAGASVELRKLECTRFSNPPEVFTVISGTDGKFNFANLRPGNWCVVATMAGGQYTPAEYMQRGALGRGATIPIADGEKITSIQLAMAPTGGIAGRVRDLDGEYLARARVQLMEAFTHDGIRRLYILQVTQTNDKGEYRFYWLPPGPYYVAVVPENPKGRSIVSVQPPPGTGGHREDVITPVVRPRISPNGDLTEETYVPVYYPSETDMSRALPIEVQSGNSTNGIDIVLSAGRTRSFHIRGSVLNGATGEPAGGAQIRLVPRQWTSTVVMPSTTTDQKGEFDLTGVVPGSYYLLANMSMQDPSAPPPAPPGVTPRAQAQGAPPPAPAIPLSANIPLEMNNTDIERVQISVAQGIRVSGKVMLEGATAELPRGITVSLVRDPDIVGMPGSQLRGQVQPDGTFSFTNVGQGEYRVYVPPLITPFQWDTPNIPQQFQNTFVKSVTVGNVDALTSKVQVVGGLSPGDIQVVLSTGSQVDGFVSNDRREPAANVTVALVPDGPLRNRRDLFRSVTTDISGKFKLQGVPPGSYKAFAWEQVEQDMWQNPDFIRPYETRGVVVEIRNGSQATAEVQAIAAPRR